MTDSLSRLRAGLDRDEAIARAAAEHDTAGTGDGTWFAGEADHHGIGLCASEQQAARIDYYPTADTEHITLHDPSRVLRQTEVFRKLLAEYDSHLVYGPPFEDSELEGNGPDIWEGRDQVFKLVFEALAEIYPEDTTETGDRP